MKIMLATALLCLFLSQTEAKVPAAKNTEFLKARQIIKDNAKQHKATNRLRGLDNVISKKIIGGQPASEGEYKFLISMFG